jgi:hypothetical protein
MMKQPDGDKAKIESNLAEKVLKGERDHTGRLNDMETFAGKAKR